MDSAGDSEPGWLAATEERSGSWVTGVGFTVGLAMASIGFYIASIGVVVVLLAPELGLSVGQLAWVGSLFGYGLLVMAVTGPVLLRLGANRVVALAAKGAHVVLVWGRRDQNPAESDLRDAAGLAALHSRARTSATVPVDWTRRKYVRKPRKSPPGQVLVERAKTVFVEPDAALEERLRG